MSSYVWAAGALAVIAGALLLIRALFFARPRRGPDADGRLPTAQTWTPMANGGTIRVRLAPEDLKPIRDEIQALHVIRKDLNRVGNLLERLLEEAMAVDPARVNPPRPAGGAPRVLAVDPGRRITPEPVQGAPSQRMDRDPPVQHDGGFDPNPLSPAAHEPPPDAVNVEASNDVVVPSDRHPPEAWMARGEVSLNPRVTLTDPALQRWSTFFDWERREPGARYQTTRPASVTANGAVVRKGMARPQ